MNRPGFSKKSLADCLGFKSGEINAPKSEILDVEVIHGRSVSSYLPVSQGDVIPEFYIQNVGHELGGPTEIFWTSNIFVKNGVLFGSGFFPLINSGGNIESRDSFEDSNIEKFEVDRILSEPSFLVTTHTSAHAFYHFMIDYLPRLQMMGRASKSSNPLLFSRYRVDFQYQAMDILMDKIYPVYSMSSGILLRECGIMTPVSKVDAVDFLRERSAHVVAASSPKRLYVSRRYAISRRIVNEEKLEPILRKFGFEIIYCEYMSLGKQISLFKSAEFVCAPHGAGLANIAYCNSNTSILEIIMPERFPLGALFWELACAAGLNYHILEGVRIPLNEDVTTGDIYVEPEKFEAALSHMMEQNS